MLGDNKGWSYNRQCTQGINISWSTSKKPKLKSIFLHTQFSVVESKTVKSHFLQVLCSAWKDDGTIVFSGGCDKQVKMWPLLSGGQPVTVAMHDAPIKEVAWVPEMNLLVTGSWDKTIK